jgi:hypothetical protein
MKKIHFSTTIHAPVEKVWDSIVNDAPYREWTDVFSPGSHFQGSWEKGSKILFLGPDPKTGAVGGMVSEIAESTLHKYISIRHLGMVHNGVEDTTSDEVKKWAPGYENYSFEARSGETVFAVDMDTTDEYYEYFIQVWPKALEKLKEVAERN